MAFRALMTWMTSELPLSACSMTWNLVANIRNVHTIVNRPESLNHWL